MIKIVDLFAGPGGLGEGFASFVDERTGERPFSIIASVEKEPSAHSTLQLRAFFRKFPPANVPDEYYQYVRGEGISKTELFSLYPTQSAAAIEETLDEPRTLGIDNDSIEAKILERLQRNVDPVIVIGGPPCQAYSLVGRARNMGNASYVPEDDARHFLYREYLNILSLVSPDVFVMENVKGILSSKLDDKRIFPQILNDLRNPRVALCKDDPVQYRIYSLVIEATDPTNPSYIKDSDFIIKSEKFGIPQSRHRVILLGIRDDVETIPGILEPMPVVSTGSVIGDLPMLRSGLSKGTDNFENWSATFRSLQTELYEELNDETYAQLAERIGDLINEPIEELDRGKQFISKNFDLGERLPEHLRTWLLDPRLEGVLNHETRGHIREDLKRYLFAACFAEQNNERENPTPKAKEFPAFLAPNHKNWESGKFADRFRVQAEAKYATTVTSHISKDGHYFIHYDPSQCRSLTVREAARIQTFPDNYFFEGNRTQQYVQVGNAVPPFLASQIAHIVNQLFP